MNRTAGIVTDLCRLCMKNNDYYYNIFTSNVACRVTVKDAMHGLLGLEVAVGDGLPSNLCPVCLKKLTEFSVFKKICLESDANLRRFGGSNYFRSIQGDEATDDELGSSADTKDFIQDEIQGTSHLTHSVQTTEIYIPVPDSQQPEANILFNLKEENEDPLTEGNYSVMHTTDPAIISTDVSEPLTTDDWAQTSTSSQGEEVDAEGTGAIVIDLDTLLVLANKELSPKETYATEPTDKGNGGLVQNGTMAMESMTEAVELPAPERASALLEPKIRASHSMKGKKVKRENLSNGKDLSFEILVSRRETVSSFQPSSSNSFNQPIIKGVRQKGNGLLKENLRETREKENVRQARTSFIVDGKSYTDSRHTATKSYSCNECDKTFSQKGNLDSHIRIHTKKKPYPCSECDKSFSQKGNLVHHIRTHTKEKPYCCGECEKSFSLRCNLVAHIRTHTKEKPYSCNECDKTFSQKGNLDSHIRIHTKKKPYPCSECDKSFSQKGNLVHHIRTHTKEKPYCCGECEKSFSLRCNLVAHIRTHTKEKPYSCNECDKTFSQKGNLDSHIRIHTKKKPYPCSECDKSFSQKGNLVHHIRTHTKEKPYCCGECEKSFSLRCNLVAHIRTHTKEKPYSCNECDKTFSQKGNLDSHIRIHTKEKPYSCGECEKSFSQKSHLVRHIRTHTKEKPYSCNECDKSYTSKRT